MSSSAYTEDTLVQQTAAEYLEQQLGWESVFAYNNEDFGPDSLLGRTSDREVVLTRYLRQKLVELNPGLPDSPYDDAVRQIAATVASQTIVATNREKHDLIRDGVQVAFRNEAGELKKERLRVLDFEHPENNHFLCVRELWVRGDLYHRRVDIVGFVNGLPLLFLECKNIHKNLKTAFEKNYSDCRDTIPHVFHHNAIVMFGNGDKAKIGSITSQWGHFHEWTRLAEEEPGAVDMETLLKGVCDKWIFLDLVENFIVFDESSGAPKKILARNHQFLGVNRAIGAVRDRDNRQGKLGVFWHTQGAGKSYSMVFFTRKIHRKLGGDFTFVILTDREDLDTQIYKTFAGCGLVDNDRNPCRPTGGAHLERLLTEHKSYVFSLIQKFNRDVDPTKGYTKRDNIIVITDEAHRTQYGTLALNMRNALPHASYIGFTGTPLFKDDEITMRVFGKYVSTYDFQRAVEDKATVALYYDARGEKLGVGVGDVNERIAEKLEEFETEDVDVQQRLERELKRDYHIITAEKRLDQIARDFVRHYATAWQTGKAMLVCIDKLTCVRMHKLITKYWSERIRELSVELVVAADDEERLERQRQLEWMKESEIAVVISEEQGEVDKFRKHGLNIRPHRRLIKQGIELPESMRQKPQFQNMQRMALDDAWILRHLRKALATYAGQADGGHGQDVGIDPTRPEEELLAELAEAIAFARRFLEDRGASLVHIIERSGFERNAAILAAKEVVNENDETRKRFEVMCREVFKKFKACINISDVNDYRRDRDAVNIVYKSLQKDREQADISDIIRQLHGIVDEAIDTRDALEVGDAEVYDISKIDFERLRQEFERSPAKNTVTQNLRQVVENRLKRLLERNPLRTDFQQHYENIVADYNREKDRATIEHTFRLLLKFMEALDEEEERAVREGLDEESLAIFDLLKKPELSPTEVRKIKAVATELLRTLKAEKLRVHLWKDKEATRDSVKGWIRDFLYSDETGLPVGVYSEADVQAKADDVYRHVFRAYPTVPSPFYINDGGVRQN